jgi:acetyltransferase-like isoleucine patch superfamily enzyme
MIDDLLTRLRELWRARRAEVDARYRRTLPLGDYVVDRWEKARALGFGEGTSVYDSVLVLGDVTVGRDSWIGPFVVLDGSGGLTIGSYCSISAGVQLYSHDSVRWAVSGGGAPYEHARTTIGDNCYIGPNTVVAKGVTIGDGCVVGANSLVLHDLPAGSKAYGTPCRVVGPVDGTAGVGPVPSNPSAP